MEIRSGKNFAGYMKGIRKRTLEVTALVPADKEHWRLNNGMSPIDIIIHIAQTEQALWGKALQTGRVGALPQPTDVQKASLAGALAFAAQIREENNAYWNDLGEKELSESIIGPTGQQVMLSRWLMLAPEHEIHHRSFLHAYRKMWDLSPHPIYGLTFEDLKTSLQQ